MTRRQLLKKLDGAVILGRLDRQLPVLAAEAQIVRVGRKLRFERRKRRRSLLRPGRLEQRSRGGPQTHNCHQDGRRPPP